MEKNIKLLGIINFFTDFRLYSPVAIIYFSQVSGSYMTAMLVFSVTGLASTFFELPTGILSDRIGRKMTLTAGALAGTLSVGLYAAASGSFLLMAGAVFEGLASAFYSGNNSALLYDSLKVLGKEKEFHGYSGRVNSFFQIALALSALLGGIIAQQSIRLVLIISVFFQAAIIPLSLFLKNPPSDGDGDKSSMDILKKAFRAFRENRELRRVSLANLISDAGGESAYQFQAAFVSLLWPVWAVGLARTLSNLGGAVSFWFSGKVIDRYGVRTMMLVSKIYSRITHIIALGIPTMASPVLISTTSLFFGVSCTASESFNHSHFTDSERATMGSITSFAGALLFAVYSPLLGWGADLLGPAKAMIISQIIMVIPILMLLKKETAADRVRQ
ncbi:MFS transporter [Spirochaeta isovalerica]|uniref:MFS family permease n=1 Tax=Spirochaeta isovalerica TaxID=150 RepID=A0A841R6Z3_9SPIO|nr:MFS transporter [Spirochaeta isovalerica]MBB6480994.1 MFS family permease [Spirochaeta isovalerica]